MAIEDFMNRDERSFFQVGCRDILKEHGLAAQELKLIEETGELTQAWAKAKQNPSVINHAHYIEELADVLVVAHQILEGLHEVDANLVAQLALKKVKRELDRIEYRRL
jgi:NTP pyrophosphatase (non-canonical NTP hydrolase)